MVGELLKRKKVYDDILNDTIYYCDAVKGSALTDSVWKVTKKTAIRVGAVDIEEITSTDGYNNPATDLATVQGLTYR